MFRLHPNKRWVLDGIHAFYINALLRALVFALISIFIPIFIYKNALSFGSSIEQSIIAVAVYYLIMRIVVFIIDIPGSKIIEKIGFRRSVIISIVFVILQLISFLLADRSMFYIWLGAVFAAVNVPFYWVARDSALSQDASGVSMGRSMGNIATLEKIAYLSGPFVAGAIITIWGFSILFSICLILLLISAIPLLWMPHHSHKNGVSFRGFLDWLKFKNYFHQAAASFGSAMEDCGLSIIWPLALFLIGFNAGVLGAVFSAVSVVTVAVQYIVGVVFDRLHRRYDLTDEIVYFLSSVGSSFLWIVRLFIYSIPQVVITDSIGQVFQTAYYGFQSDYAHLGGKRMGSISYWVYMEMVYSIAVILFALIMIIAVHFDIWKPVLFLLVSVFVFLSTIQAKESNIK